MKQQTKFLEKLAAIFLIMAMVMPQYAAATITDGESIVIDANDNVTVNVDADNLGAGSFIVNDENFGFDTITTILSNAQSTTIGAGDANTITNSLTVAGTTTTNSGALNVGGATTLDSTLGVTGATTLTGALTANGGISADGGVFTVADTTGNVATSGTLDVAGLSSLDGGIDVNGGNFMVATNGNTSIGGTLGVTGNTSLSTLSTSGLATLDSASITNNATVGGTLGVTGNTSLSTLSTSGLATLDSASITNNATVGGTLGVTGNTSLSTLSTSGLATLDSASITNNATVGGTLGVTGALTANGGATLNSADSYSSATVGNSAVTLVADSDALSTNAQSSLSMAPTSASLLVNNNTTGESHGITISQTSTVISGGTDSTTLTLDDDGATFADEDTGAPVKVTGVADGVGAYDAVNMRQYNKLEDRVDKAYSGIASVAALAAIPPPVSGKDISLGLGYGNFENQNALAVGGKALVGKDRNMMLTGGVGFCGSTTTLSAGVGWSF